MSKIISNEQLGRLARYHAGIGEVLTEVLLSPDHSAPAEDAAREWHDTLYDHKPGGESAPASEPIPFGPSFPPIDWREDERGRRELEMSRLCGRWTAAPHRCGIEIARRGEHFVLTHLKRNGRPTGERYVLLWYDGEIRYYGAGNWVTVLALDRETDTLMLSPGEDYIRQRDGER